MSRRCLPLGGSRRGRRRAPPLALPLLLAVVASGCGVDVPVPIHFEPFRIVSSDASPAWSTDGKHIAYVHTDDSVQGVWLVDTAGAAPHQIVSGAWLYLDWSPDGARLALAGSGGIYSLDPNGGPPRLVTTSGGLPRWSLTGTTIAFQNYDAGGAVSIGLVAPDGSGRHVLAPPDTEAWTEPDWSPDGMHLVHVRRLGLTGPSDLFVMDTTGHGAVRLTTDGSEDRGPAWSPDGQWIAWSVGASAPELWIMKSDGTGAHLLTAGGDASWSPDSRQIAYTLQMFNVVRLFAIDITTGRTRQITR